MTTRILVADDNDAVRGGLVSWLTRTGYDVVGVDDIAPATAQLDGAPFDVLIVDLHLRTGSGLEIVRHCRARGITPYFVMLSGDETADALEAARLAGVDAVLFKPARLAALREVLSAGVRARAA